MTPSCQQRISYLNIRSRPAHFVPTGPSATTPRRALGFRANPACEVRDLEEQLLERRVALDELARVLGLEFLALEARLLERALEVGDAPPPPLPLVLETVG